MKNKKRIGTIALSAILLGSAAAGTFTGASYVIGAEKDTEQSGGIGVAKTLKMTDTVTKDEGKGSLDVSDIAEAAMPAVVAITNKSVKEVQNFFSMYGRGGYMQQEVENCGSGAIVGETDDEILIVTNNHVVEDSQQLSVCFADDKVYEATIKGTDVDNDLAIVAVKRDDLSDDTVAAIKVLQIGKSDDLKVGQQVVAIGNALGYGQSVTTGIVSALNRQVSDDTSSNGYIQTDAAINPGNSGGVLLNMQGQMVGINSAKLASTEVEGMGYAIPESVASPIMESLLNRSSREKASADEAAAIGISGKTVDSAMMQYNFPAGVYVAEVSDGGAAQEAGIPAGCVITSFDGSTVKSIEGLKDLISYYKAGESVEVGIKVADNGEYVDKTVTVTLGKAEVTDTTTDSTSDATSGATEQTPNEEDYNENFDGGSLDGFSELIPYFG